MKKFTQLLLMNVLIKSGSVAQHIPFVNAATVAFTVSVGSTKSDISHRASASLANLSWTVTELIM